MKVNVEERKDDKKSGWMQLPVIRRLLVYVLIMWVIESSGGLGQRYPTSNNLERVEEEE